MKKSLKDKVVLITGAASGIGRLTALEMARQGAKLVIWDINESALDAVCNELDHAGTHKSHGYVCDISNREAVYSVAEEVLKEVGAVDVLINNAGIVSGKSILEIPDEKIELTFGVNTMALFWTTKAFLPEMLRRDSGHIVTIASSAGLVGAAKLTDYCASKWAAVGFDESLRMELRERSPGVKTTVVCPFFIDTGMFKGATTRFPLILPILKEKNVATKIVNAVQTEKKQLIMPGFVGVVPLMRATPVWFFDAVADILGINKSMEDFIGRKSATISDLNKRFRTG